MVDRILVRSWRRAVGVTTLAVLLGACGGGGGGGGGQGAGPADPPPPDGSVTFQGFSFQTGAGPATSTPPLEDQMATPPSLGGPLDTTVVFRFDGVPEGPFNGATLPVFTTPTDVTPAAGAPANLATIPAKGEYVVVGNTVEFRPFVPTDILQINLSAPPAAVPGLLPASIYTARVSDTVGAKLGNLAGAGGETRFGTTSNPAAYYTVDADGQPPELVASVPADGSVDFYPGVFSPVALGAATPTFPPGDEDLLLTYDRPIAPTLDNLLGEDADGDGLVDPVFFLRMRSTRLLVSHEVPGGAFGAHGPFAAVSGLLDETPVSPVGDDVFLHADSSGALPDPDAGLGAVPSSLAVGRDTSLLFALLPVDGDTDRLTVADHVLGDPGAALLAEDGAGSPAALDTGLDELVGLVTLLDGRLVAYDRTSRRIHELLPTLVRRRPSVGAPAPGAPVLVDLAVGDGINGFRSEPLSDPAGPADLDVLDLAQAPSGALYAVAKVGGSSLASLVRLAGIDPELDGAFEPGDGTFSGLTDDVVLLLGEHVVDVSFVSDTELLLLDRGTDRILRADLTTGDFEVVVDGVAAFGAPLASFPDGLSPARALAAGVLEADVDLALLANGDEGAILRLAPAGLLPIGQRVDVMQRLSFRSLTGVSELNASGTSAPVARLGARRLLSVHTARPGDPGLAHVDDAFHEEFDDTSQQADDPTTIDPPAEWATPVSGGGTTGGLRASVGASEAAQLGDFLPGTSPEYLPDAAWTRSSGASGEPDLDKTTPFFTVVLLDTDAQNFPLADGSTPGITQPLVVQGGHFIFRDVIIPEGVRVVAKGTRPLVITATRHVEIHGLLDVSGTNGFKDDAFDSAILPVAGGPGGPGGGKGGDGHPTTWDPNGPGSIDQQVTPETGERGWGPVVGPAGQITYQQVGGHGGLSTAGYDPSANGVPKVPNSDNTEHHRPPGGGGGTFYYPGAQAHEGAGAYRVQSNSTWFPFSECPTNDKIHDALYGDNERISAGVTGAAHTQCVYLVGTTSAPERFKPGGLGGDLVFKDGDPENDFIGADGELAVLLGGQGGGGGGSRVDSLRHNVWSANSFGAPVPAALAPPYYPKLFGGGTFYFSPTLYDARGGGGGGGSGSLQIRSFGDIVIGRTGHVDASGGHGGGAEMLSNASRSGGGGGGSGGAILLQAAGEIILRADAGHKSTAYKDTQLSTGDVLLGAALDVSGGMGRDAKTRSQQTTSFQAFSYDVTRSDGGQGGFGLIQLHQGGNGGVPTIEEGAFLFAQIRAEIKLGPWTGDPASKQADHTDFIGNNVVLPDELRYLEMLHYRYFRAFTDAQFPTNDRYFVLNGSFPPIIPSTEGDNGWGPIHEYPATSGQLWFDTLMMKSPDSGDRFVVQEPQPEWILETWNGINANWKEINNPQSDPDFPGIPGTTYKDRVIPFSTDLKEPQGMPHKAEVDGQEVFDPRFTVDRLPVVPLERTPPPFSSRSSGVSRWLDFSGVALRARDGLGRTPPFFAAVHGTWNAATGAIPAGHEGRVQVGAPVPFGGIPARYVMNSGAFTDPGLFGQGTSQGDPPYNDIKVDAPDPDVLLDDVITDNAHVLLLFQGAHPVRAGSQVPDPQTLTPWVDDLTALDGHALVRFQVVFDLEASPDAFPYGVDSLRPQVDRVRLRMRY